MMVDAYMRTVVQVAGLLMKFSLWIDAIVVNPILKGFRAFARKYGGAN